MPGCFDVHITDLSGNVVAAPQQFEDLSVEIPLNESRVAKLDVSIFDRACQEIRPLDRMVKIFYSPHVGRGAQQAHHLVFVGYIVNPVWSANGAKVTLNCHDATLKLKHHYHRYGDVVVGTRTAGGYPMDTYGARLLLASALPDPLTQPGIPSHGILHGVYGTHTELPRPPDLEATYDPLVYGHWRVAERGAQVWETMTNLMTDINGFDIDFKPVDLTFPPDEGLGEWEPGMYCQMDCWEKQGTDRSVGSIEVDKPVAFYAYFAGDNLEDFTYQPDGDAVKNQVVVSYPGGQASHEDLARIAEARVPASQALYGIYEMWESSGQRDGQTVLQAKANAYAGAYGLVPQFFKIKPITGSKPPVGARLGSGVAPRYSDNYFVGDLVTASVKRGYFSQEGGEDALTLTGRVTKVTLNMVDAAGSCQEELEIVPHVVETLEGITAVPITDPGPPENPPENPEPPPEP